MNDKDVVEAKDEYDGEFSKEDGPCPDVEILPPPPEEPRKRGWFVQALCAVWKVVCGIAIGIKHAAIGFCLIFYWAGVGIWRAIRGIWHGIKYMLDEHKIVLIVGVFIVCLSAGITLGLINCARGCDGSGCDSGCDSGCNSGDGLPVNADRYKIEYLGFTCESADQVTLETNWSTTSDVGLSSCVFDLRIYNADGEKITSAVFDDVYCRTGDARKWEISINIHDENQGDELYFTDPAYLTIELAFSELTFEGKGSYEYDGVRRLHTADTGARNAAYERAIEDYNRGNTEAAYDAFCKLGNYERAEELRRQIAQDTLTVTLNDLFPTYTNSVKAETVWHSIEKITASEFEMSIYNASGELLTRAVFDEITCPADTDKPWNLTINNLSTADWEEIDNTPLENLTVEIKFRKVAFGSDKQLECDRVIRLHTAGL